MSAASDDMENDTLKLHFTPGYTSWATGTPYVALFLADPGDTGTASTEVTGGAYTRQLGTFTVANGTATLSATITFDGMPAVNTPGVGAIAVFTAQTGGKMVAHVAASQAKVVTAGDSVTIASGNLSFTMD